MLTALLMPSAHVLADGHEPTGGSEGGRLDGSEPLPSKPRYPRLESQLSQLVEYLEVVPQSASLDALWRQLIAEKVPVTVRVSGGAFSTLALLGSAGARIANTGGDWIEAIVPVTLLSALATHEAVTRVERIVPPQPDVTSEGRLLHRAHVWNDRGFTGEGVKVGVIDGGFLGFGGLMGTELPSSVVVRCYTAIGIFTPSLVDCEAETNHGTAVAEAITDMAPDVSLYIANPMSRGDLQSAASWMLSQGVEVINMSLSWTWDGPGDGTSPYSDSPLRTVDLSVAGGAIWVNSAGNQALRNWYGPYSDADGDGRLEFAPGGVECNDVTLSSGERIVVQARWDGTWAAAARDFDLYLYSGVNLVAFSEDPQSGAPGQDPYERIGYTATAGGPYCLRLRHVAGGVPSWLRVGTWNQDLAVSVSSHSIENPAESGNPGMLAVGAADWATPDTIEGFSSQGPTTDGRTKPDIVGVDRGDSATRGPRGFAGTSQSSPHVAGLAALVVEQFPGLTPAETAGYLKDNAVPRGAVPNDTWGYGLARLPLLPAGPATDLTAVAGQGEASVSWSAPTSDGGQPIIRYAVTSNPGSLNARADGILDTSFGADGYVLTGFGPGNDGARGMAV